MQNHSTRITISCEHCHAEFSVIPSRIGKAKYCSRACKFAQAHVEFTCQHCQKTETILACRAIRKKFCSHVCSELASCVDAEERFFSYIGHGSITKTGCIVWLGSKNENGYGKIKVNDRLILTHRFSYEILVGPIPDGLDLCHTCDNPPCLNPTHLFPGTRQQNMDDAVSKGRIAHGERHGNSKLTEDDIREIRKRHAVGDVSFVSLGKQFAISGPATYKIVKRIHWPHVD